jgi:hypothetical protein
MLDERIGETKEAKDSRGRPSLRVSFEHGGAPPPAATRPREASDAPMFEPHLAWTLRQDVRRLSFDIGERNLMDRKRARALHDAAELVTQGLTDAGWAVRRERLFARGHAVDNIVAELGGSSMPEQIVVVGAHYDSAPGSPGANDNATGVAALLAMARSLGRCAHARTLRFVGFVNEEHPFTRTRRMGSLVHARDCKNRGERIVGMISLETLGSYYAGHRGNDAPFPLNLLSPWRGDFVAVVGNLASRALVRRICSGFGEAPPVPARPLALPGFLPLVKSSDHWSFWKQGYPAVMITDTAPLRYRHYHRSSDCFEHVDFVRLAALVPQLVQAVDVLAG